MRTFGVALLAALSCFAANPVGTVSGDAPFQLRGIRVPAAGVQNWPVLAGDEIVSQTAIVTLRFRDGSIATLTSGTRARVQSDGEQIGLNVLGGSLEVTPAVGASLNVYRAGQPVLVQPGVPVTVSATAPAASAGGSRVRSEFYKLPPLSVRK